MSRINSVSYAISLANELAEGFEQLSYSEKLDHVATYRDLRPDLVAYFGETVLQTQPYDFMAKPLPLPSFEDEQAELDLAAYDQHLADQERAHEEQLNAEDEDRFDPDISRWMEEEDTRNPSDEDDIELLRTLDFQDVYGISVMGQAMRFIGKDY